MNVDAEITDLPKDTVVIWTFTGVDVLGEAEVAFWLGTPILGKAKRVRSVPMFRYQLARLS